MACALTGLETTKHTWETAHLWPWRSIPHALHQLGVVESGVLASGVPSAGMSPSTAFASLPGITLAATLRRSYDSYDWSVLSDGFTCVRVLPPFTSSTLDQLHGRPVAIDASNPVTSILADIHLSFSLFVRNQQ